MSWAYRMPQLREQFVMMKVSTDMYAQYHAAVL